MTRLTRLVAAAVLVVLILVSLGYLGLRWARDGAGAVFASSDSGLSSQRDAVMSQARQFALRINTYGPSMLQGKTMPSYAAQVEAVLTDAYRADFEKSGLPLAEATVSQDQVKASAQVFATGVAALGDDTATVLIAGQLDFAYPTKSGAKTYTKPRKELFRWEVQLDDVGGRWLVDSFNPAESSAVTGPTSGSGAS